MGIEFKDLTGHRRSLDDLVDAKKSVEIALVRYMLEIPPGLGVCLLTIRDALEELIALRAFVKRIREEMSEEGKEVAGA